MVTDMYGKRIDMGDEVEVGEPKAGDMHQHGFKGTVVDVDPEQEIITVVDQDGDCYDVDSDNVEVL